ncbi:MAG: ABC transporter substrate binding protein [Candidatus Binatia bacterium]
MSEHCDLVLIRGGKRDRYPELTAELVRLKIDIIVVARGTSQVRAAKSIPIVMTSSGLDLVEAVLVDSLAHPGGNVTGITTLNGELGGKRLELLLKEAVSKPARFAVLYPANTPPSVIDVKKVLPGAARARKWPRSAYP